MKKYTVILYPFFILAMVLSGLAVDPASTQAQTGGQAPISITADQMEADDKQKVVHFVGSVVARQDDVTVNCDRMRVFYQAVDTGETSADKQEESGLMGLGGGSNEIKRVECEGNVKITQGDRVALGQKAIYMAKGSPRTIILTGEPRIWRNRDYLTGKRIIYYLDENRSVVEGGTDNRVNALFYQGPDQPEEQQDPDAADQPKEKQQ
jgi:lipopolysaccharide export system protein LptA